MIRIFNDQYGNSANKVQVKKVQDIRFSNLVSKKSDKKKKIIISNIYLEKNKKKHSEELSLYDKIEMIDNKTNLNELIDEAELNSEDSFDKENMSIVLNSSEFDKFQEKKEIIQNGIW